MLLLPAQYGIFRPNHEDQKTISTDHYTSEMFYAVFFQDRPPTTLRVLQHSRS